MGYRQAEPHPFGLKGKQIEFVEQYLIDLNATQAAIRAGYSIATARKIGSENLTKPDIPVAIRALRDELNSYIALMAHRTIRGSLKP